jgi:hypothetical protein
MTRKGSRNAVKVSLLIKCSVTDFHLSHSMVSYGFFLAMEYMEC